MKTANLLICSVLTSISLLTFPSVHAADAPAKPKSEAKSDAPLPGTPKPTMANVAYGKHPKQVLDFYKADSSKPTPLLFYIHGGGWQAGSKNKVSNVAEFLAAGISVVSVEYRF